MSTDRTIGPWPVIRHGRWVARGVVLLAGLLLSLQAVTDARADDSSCAVSSGKIGFKDSYRLGLWTPLRVTLAYHGSESEIEIDVLAPDSDGVATRATTRLSVAETFPDGSTSVSLGLLAKIGRQNGTVAVVVRSGPTELARWTADLSDANYRGMPSEDFLFVMIGEATHLREAVATHPAMKTRGARLAEIATVEELPSEALGYDGVDAVILLATSDAARALLADASRFAALATWVRNGGKLILSFGERADTLLEDAGPLGPMLPGDFDGMTPVLDFSALEILVDAREALQFTGSINARHAVQVPVLSNIRGRIVVSEDDAPNLVPLLVQGTYGFGEVLFFGFDLGRSELASWNGTGNLVARLLLPEGAEQEAFRASSSRRGGQMGYDDLAGALCAKLNDFESQGVRFLPFELFFFLAVLYALIIAPGDYFFLKRFVGRMEWTWLTFPTVVVGTCVGAYLLASYAKGDRQCRRQIDLVDIDLDTQQLRGTTWFSVFSPATERVDLTVRSTLSQSDGDRLGMRPNRWTVSWLGLPGRALGGMQSTATATGSDLEYRYGPDFEALEGVPINVWSTKSFTGRLQGTTQARIEPDVAISETTLEHLLAGTITNPLDVPLTHCVLLYGRWTYVLGTIQPGQQVTVHEDLTIRTLESYLSRQSSASDDPDAMAGTLGQMLFYEAARGRDASRLAHRYLSYVDMTPLLRAGKAILLARVDRAAMHISEGTPGSEPVVSHQESVYRFVFSLESSP